MNIETQLLSFKTSDNVKKFRGDRALSSVMKLSIELLLPLFYIFLRYLHGSQAARVFTRQGLGRRAKQGHK